MQVEDQEVHSVNTVNYSDTISQRQNTSTTFTKRSEKTGNNQQITEGELCDVVMIMKKYMQGRSLQKGIQMLYDYIVKKKQPQKVFCDYIPFLSHIPQAPKNYNYIPRGRSQIICYYSKNDLLQVNFSSQKEQLQYKQKRACAKMFIANGYGWQMALQQLSRSNIPIKLNKEAYKNVMSSVLASTFRQIQSFLIKDCQIKILPLDKQLLKNTLSLIIGGKLQNYGSVFKTFLRLKFGLSNVKIGETETVYFYLQLMKLLHKKKMTVQGIEQMYRQKNNSQNQSQSWSHSQQSITNKNPELSNIFDQKYNDKSFQDIDKSIIERYRAQKSLEVLFNKISKQKNIQEQFVRQRFHFLIKKALKNLWNQANPKLIELDDHQIQVLSHMPIFQDIRLNLLDYESRNNRNSDDILFLIELIKESKDLLSLQANKATQSSQNQKYRSTSQFSQDDSN